MKPKLTLIKSPEKAEKSNNFWRCCPKKLSEFPESPCSEGQPSLDTKGRVSEGGSCQWWINSEEHNFCFWTYVRAKSNKDGSMQELVQAEIAKLFGFSNTKAHFILKEAVEELTTALQEHGGESLLNDLEDNEDSNFDLG